MFNATEFTYDGIYSEQYGLKIASFNSNVLGGNAVCYTKRCSWQGAYG